MSDDHVQVGLGRAIGDDDGPGVEPDAAATAPDEDDPPTAPGGASAPSNVTVDDCTEAIAAWVAGLGEDPAYGVRQFLTTTKSSLSGTTTVVQVRGEVHGRAFGATSGRIASEGLLARAVGWMLAHLAVPYVADPETARRLRCRVVPADHLRVFVAETVWDHVAVERARGERVLARLDDLSEHTLDAEGRRRREHRRRCRDLTRAGGDIRERTRALETTARAKLGLSGRSAGPGTPDPDPRYADWDLVAIRKQLAALRTAAAAAEGRRRELDAVIGAAEQSWYEATAREIFPALADALVERHPGSPG